MGENTPYWLAFSYVPGVGSKRISRLLDAFGTLETAWGASAPALRKAGLGSKTVESILKVRSTFDLDRAYGTLQALGIELFTFISPHYPEGLKQIASPPAFLFIKGELRTQDSNAVGVVGTRQASRYGKAAAEKFVGALAAMGVTIISGLARGIDSIAHRSAIEAGGRTIAVLGSGIDRVYPAEHRRLAADICNQGALISEYPPGSAPEAQHFPARNRIIAGLSKGVVVIEAAERSGALITAGFAAEQGRDVFALPGDIHRKTSRGTNRLIQDGAHPLLEVNDVIEVLGLEARAYPEGTPRVEGVDNTQHTLLALLGDEPAHIDVLFQQSGLPIQEIQAALSLLEIQGSIKHLGGMHYLRVREEPSLYYVD